MFSFAGAVASSAQETVVVQSDFSDGMEGWSAVFADYSPEMEEGMDLVAQVEQAPAEVEDAGMAFLLGGTNLSDSLMMALKRRVGPEQGIVPGQSYRVRYDLAFASAAQSNCVGIGGAPGESVYLRAGAAAVEPEVVQPIGEESYVRLNVDAGNQASGGPAASPAGDIANGVPCEQESEDYVRLERTHRHPFIVTANADGEVWLLVLTDSGFEGRTELYLLAIEAVLTPVASNLPGSLVNLSTRARVANGDRVIGGFVIAGEDPRPILIRAVGPGLSDQGVSDVLDDPRLELHDADGSVLRTNLRWGADNSDGRLAEEMRQAGAFPLAEDSLDAAIRAELEPGAYTASVSAGSADHGVVLIEIYDRGQDELESELVNLSTRARAGAGEAAIIAGFYLRGPGAQPLLLRGIGPGLAEMEVEDPVADPRLTLRSDKTILARNENWGETRDPGEVRDAAARAGAFALEEGAADAAMLGGLLPGAYTLEVRAGDDAGIALVEVYRVPATD